MTQSQPTNKTSRSASGKPTERGTRGKKAPIAASPHRKHNGGLLLIGGFKVAEATLFVALGIGALKLLHKDLGDLLLSAATHLRLDTEGRLVTMLLGKVPLLTDNRLKEIGLGTMGYAIVKLVEGVGLLMEKTWAEYLTVILSLTFMPWEIFELVHGLTPWRVAVFASNVLIVLYLVWFLKHSLRWRSDQGETR